MGELSLGATIIAIIQWVKNFDAQNKISGWVTLPVALLVGAVAGYFHFLGTASVEAGLVAGFLAVGVHTAASAVGGK